MPNCNLTIEFYRPDRTYRSGEKVNGWIRVNVDRNVRCRGLKLTASWGTHGSGTSTQTNYWQETLFQGVWLPGETYEYPFEFLPPPAPCSYQGSHFDLSHRVSVHADIPWTVETRTDKPFRLIPGVGGTRPAAVGNPAARTTGPASNRRFIVATGSAVLAGLLLAVWIPWWWAVAAALAVPMFFPGVRQSLAEWMLDDVEWELPAGISPGHTCRTRVRFGPLRLAKIPVRRIDIRLKCFELAYAGPDHRPASFRTVMFEQTWAVEPPSADQLGRTTTAMTIAVPDIPAWSIDLPGCQVLWQCQLTVRPAWLPVYRETRAIQLVPTLESQCGTDDPARLTIS